MQAVSCWVRRKAGLALQRRLALALAVVVMMMMMEVMLAAAAAAAGGAGGGGGGGGGDGMLLVLGGQGRAGRQSGRQAGVEKAGARNPLSVPLYIQS